MNLNHLGDALDFWKGGLISRLNQHFNNLHVFPMITDTDPWADSCKSFYSETICVSQDLILEFDNPFTNQGRADYFEQHLSSKYDLFFDPDTGIGDKKKNSHIKWEELDAFFKSNPQRILMVYQHAHRTQAFPRNILSQTQFNHSFAYGAGQVCMIFLSRNKERLHKIRGLLQNQIPPEISWRIVTLDDTIQNQ